MNKYHKLDKLSKLCEELQYHIYMGKVTSDKHDLKFTCDLLFRNMIMILNLQKQDKNIDTEYGYILNNLLAAHTHLTNQNTEKTRKKFKIH
ncbi:hypothetical protein P4V41_21495 [Fictibacillus nanhaiensis]|uniref:hypothetical protein n=1 Tax=Fictibacillus nanhaiensis TaxID=742169 RepID=UPI002E2184C9|nr:hypothetical protein [Fictibacillus nanhaiensis]